jgi:hypothetical protein
MQQWRFLVIRDVEIKETVGALYKRPGMSGSPLGIGLVNRPLA